MLSPFNSTPRENETRRPRKTVSVAELVEHVNHTNKVDKRPADYRVGANALLEDVLHANNVYAGFGYYEAKDLPDGEEPGVVFDNESHREAVAFPDETRRFYYLHRSLTAGRKR